MSEEEGLDREASVLQSHCQFWDNSPGIVLRTGLGRRSTDPLRVRISDEDIKGEFTPEMLDVGKLVNDITYDHQDLPLLDGDVFRRISFAGVVPWMEAIVGCHIYSLGRGGASMVANPTDVESSDLPQYLRYLLDNLNGNAWFKKLDDGYQALAESLGTKFPLANTLMRGPGDTVGALLGHENFVRLMMKPVDNKDFLNELLDLCVKIYIKTARMQFERSKKFKGGYCNGWGLWAPGLNARTQDDEIALISPRLYNEFFLPYDIQEADAFDYTTFGMHSGMMPLYNWRGLSKKSTISAFEIALDPYGPAVEDLMGTLLEMNSEKPLELVILTDEQAKAVKEHVSDFPGSITYNVSPMSLSRSAKASRS